jgi:hypothetical protein
MAFLDITEYEQLALDNKGQPIQTGIEPALVTQSVAVAGGSTQSAALQTSTRFVRLHSDVPCRVKFGDNPTATAADFRLAAGATEYFGVKQMSNGNPMKVANITTT